MSQDDKMHILRLRSNKRYFPYFVRDFSSVSGKNNGIFCTDICAKLCFQQGKRQSQSVPTIFCWILVKFDTDAFNA